MDDSPKLWAVRTVHSNWYSDCSQMLIWTDVKHINIFAYINMSTKNVVDMSAQNMDRSKKILLPYLWIYFRTKLSNTVHLRHRSNCDMYNVIICALCPTLIQLFLAISYYMRASAIHLTGTTSHISRVVFQASLQFNANEIPWRVTKICDLLIHVGHGEETKK